MLLLLIFNLAACLFARPAQAAEFQDGFYFDHKYLADSAHVYQGNTLIQPNQRVGTIPDLLGNAPLQYSGNNSPMLTDSNPRYFKAPGEKEGYVFFDNVVDQKFSSPQPLSQAWSGKRELWLVMRRPGKVGNYESYIKAWKSGYFSDKGGDRIGLSENGAEASPDNSVPLPLLEKSLVRIKLNGDSSEIFINNVRVPGPLPGGYFREGNNEEWKYFVIGSDAGNAYWDWYASYYKNDNFSDAQAQEVYTQLALRHETKRTGASLPDASLPALPYAANMRMVRNGDVYTLQYDYHSPQGVSEDLGRTEIQFIFGGRGSGPEPQVSRYILQLNNKRSFNRKDFSFGNVLGNPELFSFMAPYAWFRMTVKVYDAQGRSWRFQSTDWTNDNGYPFATFPDAQFFDHKYLADQGLNLQSPGPLQPGSKVDQIPDLLGNAPMRYSGDNVAPLTGSEPRYFRTRTEKEGYIFFDNVANEKFTTISPLSQPMKGKRELWLVMRRPALSANHEAYLNDDKSGYFSDRGGERVGLSNSDTTAIAINGSVPVPFLYKSLVRIKLNGDSSEIFINNARVPGPKPGGYFSDGNNAGWSGQGQNKVALGWLNLVIGAATNNAYWDWYGSYYKRGNFTAAQAADVFYALSQRHETRLVNSTALPDKSLPDMPYASDIRVVRSGDNYSVAYTFNSPLPYPEDKTKTEYQFIYGKRGDGPAIQDAYYIPELANKSVINRQDYGLGNTLGNPELFFPFNKYAWFRIVVKVYDTAGNSWRFQSTPWKMDNEYPVQGFNDALHFNHKYLADKSQAYQLNTPIQHNQRAGRINDQIGTAHLQYSGDNVAPMPDSHPKYFRTAAEKEGYIFFDNVANEKFTTISPLSQPMTGKRELWLVMRRPAIAANFEAYLNDDKAGYFSDRGYGKTGLSNDGADAISANENVPIPFLTKTLVRIKFDGNNSEIFINNQRVQGPLAGGYFSEGNNSQWLNLVIGASTNNAYWDWYASYYKRGNFAPSMAQEVYTALAERHQIGSLPPLPYASNIKIVRTGDNYSVDYTFNSPLPYPEDKTKTEYQFIYGERGPGPNIFGAYYIPQLANQKVINRLDYAVGNTKGNPELFSSINNYAWFRIIVKVYDTEGNSWRFQSAQWRMDNEYGFQGFPDAQYFDHKYLADKALAYQASTLVQDNQRAGTIPDLVGNAPMQYSGDNITPLAESHPKYFKAAAEKEGYIFFDNVNNEKFSTPAALSQPMTGKRELWLVLRRPGKVGSFNAYIKDYHSGYFSDNGEDKIGLAEGGGESAPNASVPLPLLEKSLVRIKLHGDSSEVFVNNVRVPGPRPGGYFREGTNNLWQYFAIGSDAGNAYWDWYASYYKRGNFKPSVAKEVYTALMTRHETKGFLDANKVDKSLPALPYASNIQVVRNGDVYSLAYTFNAVGGVGEDKSRTEVQFIYGGRGSGPDLQTERYIPALTNVKQVNRFDYGVGNTLGNPAVFSSIEPNSWFRMALKVYDLQGRSWRFQSSQWSLDNDYPIGPLPVTLTRFEVKKQGEGALLTWQTATEKDNLGFEVQGSADGLTFRKLGFVASRQANSTQLQHYSFLDPAFSLRPHPVYYYRLKQIDIPGTSEYSKLVVLEQEPGQARISPIPFDKTMTVNLEALQGGQTEVLMQDIAGKVVFRQAFAVQAGPNQLLVSPQASLSPGVYFIQFQSRGKTLRFKTLRQP
ncbi:MAG: hypothetical protein ACO1O1_15430 [Adhaeribacter sp.]